MADYSELVVVFWVLPVLMQLILPLLMLIGFSLARAVTMVLGLRKDGVGLKKNAIAREAFNFGNI